MLTSVLFKSTLLDAECLGSPTRRLVKSIARAQNAAEKDHNKACLFFCAFALQNGYCIDTDHFITPEGEQKLWGF